MMERQREKMWMEHAYTALGSVEPRGTGAESLGVPDGD